MNKYLLVILVCISLLSLGYTRVQPAQDKMIPYQMREYEVSVTTSVGCVSPFLPDSFVSHVSIVSDEPLYVSLGGDAITDYGSANAQSKALRLKHAGGGEKLFIQNKGFDTVCVQSRGANTTIDIVPGGEFK